MLTFGTSVSINNLLALKSFHTFLFNYQLHEKPSFLERLMIPRLRAWVAKRAMVTLKDLLADEGAKTASISLNDVSAGLFTCLYLVQNQHEVADISNGTELFLLMAQMELEFIKIQKPKPDAGYKQNV